MATKYCDHGAYAAYAATPTWGVPQDGDGTASTASTASATVSIDLTSAVFTSGSSTVSVMGATALTVSASANSATNIQYNATLTTMIDNIVTVINTLATAAIVNKPANWQAPQIRNAVFARRTGNTLELMTRTGSASWNGLTAIAFANVTNASSGTWANGTGGCFGYAFNHNATIWASAVAIGGYGIWAAALPYAGALDAGDVVKVRANKTLTLVTNSSIIWTMAAMGSSGSPVIFEIDDGTVWPADGSSPVFKITEVFTSNQSAAWSHLATTYAHVKGRMYASGQRNLVLEATGMGPSIPVICLFWGGPVRFDYVDLYCPGDTTTSSCMGQFKAWVNSSVGRATVFYKCRIKQPGQPPSSSAYGFLAQPNNAGERLELIGCEFELTAPQTSWANGVLQPWSSGGSNRAVFDSCRFKGFVSGSKLLIGSASSPSAAEQGAIFKNCDFGNIDVFGPSMLSNTYGDGYDAGIRGLFITSQFGNREFYIERPGRAMIEWRQSKGRPYLNARLPDGITPWQIYAVTGTVAANFAVGSAPVDLPAIRKVMPAASDMAEDARTITLNFLLESTLAWTKKDISVVVSYQTTDGTIDVFDSYDPSAGALDTSTEAWSSTSWNGQTWSKNKFSVTTPLPVKEKTEVSVQVRLHSAVANDTLGVIIDPELAVS